MYTLAHCSLIISFWIGVPATKTYKGKPLAAENIYEAMSELEKLPNEKVGVTASPPLRGKLWEPWNDDGKFPLAVNLIWCRVSITVTKPKLERFELYVIECDSTESAKKHFLQLRCLNHPDYALSGRYLLKGPPQALEWFTKHYGSVRYGVPETPPKDKK